MLRHAVSFLAAASFLVEFATSECLSNATFNEDFEELAGGPIPQEGSCCQADVCNIPCPVPSPEPAIGECFIERMLFEITVSTISPVPFI